MIYTTKDVTEVLKDISDPELISGNDFYLRYPQDGSPPGSWQWWHEDCEESITDTSCVWNGCDGSQPWC